MSVDEANNFPKDLAKIATFFDGYKSNIKESTKIYFKFCLHTPGQFEKRVAEKLAEWRNLHGFTLYKCTIQAESSRIIGWLVYSMGFTNEAAIKKLLSAKTSHEWGFTSNVITSADSKVEWKNRLKALNVMVPSNNAESARELIAKVFSQKASGKKYRGIEDCYMFVSNENQCQSEKLAVLYSAMVGRHKFRYLHIKTVVVQVIVKDIDTLITTNKNEEITLRQMILDLEPKNTKYGEQKLFHSVDYTADASTVWFKNKTIDTKVKGYILSYFSWDEAEAMHVKDGLGLYIGQKFGKTGVYDYFLEDHWNRVAQWRYNSAEDAWETPEEVAMADNVINDPMATVMQAYIDTKRMELPTEITLIADEAPKESVNQTRSEVAFSSQSSTKKSTELRHLDQEEELADNALSVAYSIKSGNANDGNEEEDSQESTLSQLAKKRAATIYRAEQDEDLDSLDVDNENGKQVNQVLPTDDVSHASSLTDLTDNTKNLAYYKTQSSDETVQSYSSSLSIKSLKESDLSEIITADMSPAEIEQSIHAAVQMQIKRTKEKAKLFVERAQQIQKQKELLGQNEYDQSHLESTPLTTDKIRGDQKETEQQPSNSDDVQNTSQSGSDCNAANKE